MVLGLHFIKSGGGYKSYVRMNCAVKDSSSGTAVTVAAYLEQLRKALQPLPDFHLGEGLII